MQGPMICGVDTGGTFTDCVVVADDQMYTAKVPSTPHNVSVGFFNALADIAEQRGQTLEAFAGDLSQLFYGTTVATNIVVERSGAVTGLITTRGFTDTLLTMRGIGRVMGVAPDRMMRVSGTSKPAPLIPRRLTRGVVERIDWSGEVIVALDEDSVKHAARELLDAGVDSIAVSFLWSFVNPAHEHRARDIISTLAPEVFVTCSADVAPRWGEYERTAAAGLNAYVGPATTAYLRGIGARATELGIRWTPLILQCAGGAVPIGQAGADAVRTIGSGPTAGVIASGFLGAQLGYPHVICADVGGTTFDVGLVRDGKPVTATSSIVSQYKYFVPAVEVQSIGAGGGSIAWVDPATGGLYVGPQSAGASPGPACYGRGGTEPTVTDAAAVLGYLSPGSFLGGRMPLDVDAAATAIETIAIPLGMSVVEAAAGIIRIAEHHMADLVRKVTIQRGYDPADFVLFAYGGAGPVHAGVFGRELGVFRIIVPLSNRSSLWSAFGAAVSDLSRVFERSLVLTLPASPDQIIPALRDLTGTGRDWLSDLHIDEADQRVTARVDMRYVAQLNEIEIELPLGEADFSLDSPLVARFEKAYAQLFGHGSGYRAAGMEITALRVEAVGQLPKPALPARTRTGAEAAPVSSRDIYWPALRDWARTPIYRGVDLQPGQRVAGPAIVEYPDTTLVVHLGDAAVPDRAGNVELVVGGPR
jgi:N-methylhydantoinase A